MYSHNKVDFKEWSKISKLKIYLYQFVLLPKSHHLFAQTVVGPLPLNFVEAKMTHKLLAVAKILNSEPIPNIIFWCLTLIAQPILFSYCWKISIKKFPLWSINCTVLYFPQNFFRRLIDSLPTPCCRISINGIVAKRYVLFLWWTILFIVFPQAKSADDFRTRQFVFRWVQIWLVLWIYSVNCFLPNRLFWSIRTFFQGNVFDGADGWGDRLFSDWVFWLFLWLYFLGESLVDRHLTTLILK